MSLRRFLQNPSGGQVFSACVLLSGLVALEAILAFGLGRSLLSGAAVKVNDLGVMAITGVLIASVINFLRSRHGSR